MTKSFKTLGTVRVNEYLVIFFFFSYFFKLQQHSTFKCYSCYLEMKTAFFFVFIAFILACGLVFCEEYETELMDVDKTQFEDEDKTEFDDKLAQVDDPYKKRRCNSLKHQY